MPVSVVEAMACGLPVASVNAKGIPEIVIHGKNGLLAEPDRPELLAQAIIQLFRRPSASQKKVRHRGSSRNNIPRKISPDRRSNYMSKPSRIK